MVTSKAPKKDNRQSLEKVRIWQEETLPNLKKKALEEDYEIYYHDESTLQLCSNVVTTYSPQGETPILASNDTKGYQYVCLASSISAKGDMYFEVRNKAFKGTEIVEYLISLLKTTTKKIMIIWDNASWHKSNEVKTFLNTDLGKRVWIANLPPYSPEFNPDELVWAYLKKVKLANSTAKNTKMLTEMANTALTQIKESVDLVKSFFNSKNFNFTD